MIDIEQKTKEELIELVFQLQNENENLTNAIKQTIAQLKIIQEYL
jgi:ribosomal protein L29